jgi:DNA-binding MarR family transcriptional regulator
MQIEVQKRKNNVMSSQLTRLLLKLYGKRYMGFSEAREFLQVEDVVFSEIIKQLQYEYLVDVVTYLDDRDVKEYISLTERGEKLVFELMEKTYELPEQ